MQPLHHEEIVLFTTEPHRRRQARAGSKCRSAPMPMTNSTYSSRCIMQHQNASSPGNIRPRGALPPTVAAAGPRFLPPAPACRCRDWPGRPLQGAMDPSPAATENDTSSMLGNERGRQPMQGPARRFPRLPSPEVTGLNATSAVETSGNRRDGTWRSIQLSYLDPEEPRAGLEPATSRLTAEVTDLYATDVWTPGNGRKRRALRSTN